MNMALIISIAFSLSLDAFSLALAYGTLNIKKKKIFLTALITGIFHFLMPLLGNIIGNKVLAFIRADLIAFVLLSLIGINMMRSDKKDDVKELSLAAIIVFAFSVSLDAFSAGIGLSGVTDNVLLAVIIFAIFSFGCTALGLLLGKKIGQKLGDIATKIGGCILILVGIICLFRF